jgi:hypothetical protein
MNKLIWCDWWQCNQNDLNDYKCILRKPRSIYEWKWSTKKLTNEFYLIDENVIKTIWMVRNMISEKAVIDLWTKMINKEINKRIWLDWWKWFEKFEWFEACNQKKLWLIYEWGMSAIG